MTEARCSRVLFPSDSKSTTSWKTTTRQREPSRTKERSSHPPGGRSAQAESYTYMERSLPTRADMSHRNVVGISSILVLSVGFWAGCSANGNTGSDLTNDVTPTTPSADPGNTLPPSHTGTDEEDASTPPPSKDAGKKDSGSIDSGSPQVNTPDPGVSCAKENEIFTRACGACGTKQAACIGGVVTDYSSCLGETGECEPGASLTESCGNCGSHVKTCSKYCLWNATACVGEPQDACVAGTAAWTAAGCAATGAVRSRSCSNACTWSALSSCATADYKLNVAGGAGGVSNAIIPILQATRVKKVSGACASPTLSATDDHAASWVTVSNRNAQTAVVTVWTATAQGGPALLDTSLVAYATKPTTDDEAKACIGSVGESCPTATLPCGDNTFGALYGNNALTIPAGESRVIGVVISAVAGQATSGPVTLSVRTDSLQ